MIARICKYFTMALCGCQPINWKLSENSIFFLFTSILCLGTPSIKKSTNVFMTSSGLRFEMLPASSYISSTAFPLPTMHSRDLIICLISTFFIFMLFFCFFSAIISCCARYLSADINSARLDGKVSGS